LPRADVIVIGGGVAGAASAWSLAREGVSVALLERDAIAGQASGAAAGMLLPVAESEGPGPLRRWGLRSLERLESLCPELRDRTGIDPEYVASGAIRVASSRPGAQALEERARELIAYGCEWLDTRALRAAEPQLSPASMGALWSPREAHVRSPLLVRALALGAEQLGARVETGVSVQGLVREGDRVVGVRTNAGEWSASHVVLCTGAWVVSAGEWLGLDRGIPVEPVRGQILSLDAPSPRFGPIVLGDDAYLVPKRDGSVVVGASEERVGFDCRVTAEGVRRLLDAAAKLVPAVADVSFRGAWAGLRPATPDGLPMIGAFPGVEGLVIAAGHHRNGVLLSAVTGDLVAGIIVGKGLPDDAAPFAPDRFIGAAAG
jgi:glycine oxidase